jgi:serine/threonine protein kinase
MAPELLLKIPYDPQKMEVWACGISLYKLLTGKFPFRGRNDDELKRSLRETEVEYPDYLSDEAVALLQKMLCKDNYERSTPTEILIDKWMYDFSLGPSKTSKYTLF